MHGERDVRPRRLGRGRSAEVFLDRGADEQAIVRKVFRGERLSKVVLEVLTGAANPYTWCQPAIRAAVARRALLALLVRYWFDDRLRLPRTLGWRWSLEHRAYELRCELVDGSHVPLRGPVRPQASGRDPLRALVVEVMRPLQRHLAAAGFDGMVWQAGRGNPVASSNFMLERRNAGTGDGLDTLRWVWIDLESGVPALFALDPRATLLFYLPRSLRHRRWLFDDVDLPKLRRYLRAERPALERALGVEAVARADGEVETLARSQEEWKTIPRHHRSIAYERSQGRLSDQQAEHYRGRPLRWTVRLLGRRAARGTVALAARGRRALARLWRLDLRRLGARAWRFASSQRYRAALARLYLAKRLDAWTRRRFLDRAEVAALRRQLRHDEAAAYLTDFAVHLMIKPPIKSLEWLAVPAALAIGWIDVVTAAILVSIGGVLGRTLYTSGRWIQAALHGRRRPWVALGIGLLPVVGNAAYPAQLLYTSTERNGELARFILYDTLAAIGRAVPIWGGPDSLTEHASNRLGDLAVRWLARPI